jgi:hypothetical protein
MSIKNRRQLEKVLSQNGLSEGIHIDSYKEIEIAVFEDSEVDRDLSEDAKDAVLNALREYGNWGGFRTGYGGWILQQNYRDAGDWNDRSSRHHY